MSQIKIPENLHHYFEETGYLQKYKAGESIYMQGENADRLYL